MDLILSVLTYSEGWGGGVWLTGHAVTVSNVFVFKERKKKGSFVSSSSNTTHVTCVTISFFQDASSNASSNVLLLLCHFAITFPLLLRYPYALL